MRQGFAWVIHITVGIIIQQDDGFRFTCLLQPFNDCWHFILQHPLVGWNIYLLSSFYVSKKFLAIYSLAMSQRLTILAYSSLDILHRVILEHLHIYICSFKHFQSLPNSLYTCGCHSIAEWKWYSTMWIEWT